MLTIIHLTLQAGILTNAIRTLENDSVKLFKWFSNNQMEANKDRCHHPLNNRKRVTMKIRKTVIKRSNCKKLLGINIGTKLIFNEQL